MKVLKATEKTQGQRGNDFCYVAEGELVFFPIFECDGESIDGKCGCRRSMVGGPTHQSITTMKVVEDPAMTGEEWVRAAVAFNKACGWGAVFPDDLLEEKAREDLRALYFSIKNFPEGAVVERRGNRFHVREEVPPPPTSQKPKGRRKSR